MSLTPSNLQIPYTIQPQNSPSRSMTPRPPTQGQPMYHPNMMTIPEGEQVIASNPLPPPPPPPQ